MTKFTTEELIALAEQNSKELQKKDEQTFLDDVHRFVLSMRIKEGTFEIKNTLMHQAYLYWGGKIKGSRQFSGSLRRFLSNKNTRRGWCFMTNMTSVKLLNRIDKLKIGLK